MKDKTVTIHVPKALKRDYNLACKKLDIYQCKVVIEVMKQVVSGRWKICLNLKTLLKKKRTGKS